MLHFDFEISRLIVAVNVKPHLYCETVVDYCTYMYNVHSLSSASHAAD